MREETNRQREQPLWYTLGAGESLRALGTDRSSGLTAAEAAARLEEYAFNELVERGAKSQIPK